MLAALERFGLVGSAEGGGAPASPPPRRKELPTRRGPPVEEPSNPGGGLVGRGKLKPELTPGISRQIPGREERMQLGGEDGMRGESVYAQSSLGPSRKPPEHTEL